jgi:serine/threonine-protein kinase
MPAKKKSDLPLKKGMLGKYRIGRKIAEGGFAVVYRARDTVEQIDVALKIPHVQSGQAMSDLLKEVHIGSRLDHPNILPIKNATIEEGRLLIAYPLAERSLDTRLRYRISSRVALNIGEQLLDAVAYAHARRVIHCDINPNNVLLFPNNRVTLADFGIARISARTKALSGSGTGTVGYIAPEQAMGRPSFRSDVFSVGLVFYRMLGGALPKWPFRAPLPGMDRLRRKLRPPALEWLMRAVEVDERKRYKTGVEMQAAFDRVKKRALR